MSAREWSPGDVAFDPEYGAVAFVVDGTHCHQHVVGLHIHYARDWNAGDAVLCRLRPLVVIDPEDWRQVERLMLAYGIVDEAGNVTRCVARMQDALRSLLTPATPEQPTNPKARIEDHRENIWRLLADGDWVCTSGPDVGEYVEWAGLLRRGPLSIEVAP